jgi:hypothetical protein
MNGDGMDKEKERESHMREGEGKGMNIQKLPHTRRKKSLEALADLVFFVIMYVRKTTMHSVVRLG